MILGPPPVEGLQQWNVTFQLKRNPTKLKYKKHTKITMEFYFPEIKIFLEILKAPHKILVPEPQNS